MAKRYDVDDGRKAMWCIALAAIVRITGERKSPKGRRTPEGQVLTLHLRSRDDVRRNHRISLFTPTLRREVWTFEYTEARRNVWQSAGETSFHPCCRHKWEGINVRDAG